MEESECDAEEGNDGQDSPCLSSQSERGSFRERGRVHRRDPVGYVRLHQAWLISPRHSRQPASDAAAPAFYNGVRWENVSTWAPDGTTTARTSPLARRIGISTLFSSLAVQPLSKP